MRPVERKWLWHSGNGLGVALFHGYRGQEKSDVYLQAEPRATAPFFTGLVSGLLRKVKSPDNHERTYGPGDTTFGDPDVVRGKVTVEILRDDTVLMCIGPVSDTPKPEFMWKPLNKALYDAKDGADITLEIGHVLVLLTGSAATTGGDWKAPAVLFAREAAMPVRLAENSVAMEGWL